MGQRIGEDLDTGGVDLFRFQRAGGFKADFDHERCPAARWCLQPRRIKAVGACLQGLAGPGRAERFQAKIACIRITGLPQPH